METKKVKSTKKPTKIKLVEGRPTVMTQEILTKLQYAFEIGASDREACLFAGISNQTLYNYQKEHPEYVEQKEQWKDKPIFIARQQVIQNIQTGDGELALKYLSKKKKDEFSDKLDVGVGVTQELQEALDKVAKLFPN